MLSRISLTLAVQEFLAARYHNFPAWSYTSAESASAKEGLSHDLQPCREQIRIPQSLRTLKSLPSRREFPVEGLSRVPRAQNILSKLLGNLRLLGFLLLEFLLRLRDLFLLFLKSGAS